MMNWRDYEAHITAHFGGLFPDAIIHHDVRRPGLISKVFRQIDILIEGKVAGFTLTIIIDCKYFGKKVDVKDVDEFIGYLHDLRASKGIIITNRGYTDAALARATNDTRDVELRIIDFKDLEKFQSFCVIPYFGAHGAIVSAPEGWVADARPINEGQLATFYPMGLERDHAFHKDGFIYFSFSKKTSDSPSLDHLVREQEEAIKDHYRNPQLSFEKIDIRDDCDCYVRHLEYEEMPSTVESTLFLDFPGVIVYLNLLSPRGKHAEYLRKLVWIGEKLIKLNVIYDASHSPLSSWKSDKDGTSASADLARRSNVDPDKA